MARPIANPPQEARRGLTEIEKTERHERSLGQAERALEMNPADHIARRNLGHALFSLGRYERAVAAYDKALALEPDNPVIWKNRAAAAQFIGAPPEPLEAFSDPKDSAAWTIRAGAFWIARRFAEAADAADQALALDSGNVAATRVAIHSRLNACDWRRREEDKRRITRGLAAGERIITPFDHRAISDSEAESRLAAQLVAAEIQPSAQPLWRGERYGHKKIRVAYISTDLRRHAVASLTAGCFERHDRARFEIVAVSLHPEDGSEMRRRLEAAFDRFIDAHAASDAAVARMLRELEIDIAIDLNGYTGRIRPRILGRRPAPAQVNYLGYAGTMALPYIDYVIADRTVIPEENRKHYVERIAYLPHSYLPNDSHRRIGPVAPSRREAGLPDEGFIFASHNAAQKIAPETFDIWMRLLREIDGSVLWLQSANAPAINNLRREAQARSVASERLIFAPRVPEPEDHLARLRLADLFLDTSPYNGHATTCDALWAGLPVLTCPGASFAGRVGASLLHAVGLPELIAPSLPEYEALALAFARDPPRLAAIRAKLAQNRHTAPLFDTAGFTRDLEGLYTAMWERTEAGLPPATLAVAGSG